VVTPFRERFDAPVSLQNDANACALAEWRWGAGRGLQNMVFLTFGTGMGAGLILNGRLYSGTNDMAGEVGHVRLAEDGPAGYGKCGSFEGFCSGGGIARLAISLAEERLRAGSGPLYCATADDLPRVTAEKVAEAANQGDVAARDVFETTGRYLGRGLAMLVDVLNPECIIVGGIYGRRRSMLEQLVLGVLREEALPRSLDACRIVPAGLGERVGTFGSLSVALLGADENGG
jgi:glucokinase